MKISIITVCFNSELTITDTIDSVFNQTYDNIEYIIIDGKSKDNTLNIVKTSEEKFLQKKISFKWISEKDCGIYDAINKGIRMATGDIIGILNSDDYFFDNNVVRDIAKSFTKNNVDCVYGNLKYIDSANKKVKRVLISQEYKVGMFERSWTPPHPTFYCRKNIYDKYGLYRIDFKIVSDVELMYRFLEKYKIKSKYIDRFMIIMRQGGVSSSGLKSTYVITKEMRQAFKDNGVKFSLLKYLGGKILKFKEFV